MEVPATAGSVPLAASEAGHAPDGAVLGARVGARFVREEQDALNAASLPACTATAGYTLVWVGAVNANAKAAQYLVSTVAPGAKHLVSVGLTDKLEVRVVSTGTGGASGGLVAQTTGAGLGLYSPVVIVARVAGGVLDLWAGQARATTDTAGQTPADLSGRLVLGAYTDGANGTSATVGELALFNTGLTDDQVAGLIRALGRKWT